MTRYRAPLLDLKFLLNDVLDLDARLRELGRDDISPEFIETVLEEGARFAQDRFAPLNRPGDEIGVTWDDGEVTTPPGFREAYQAYCDNGWSSMSAPPEFGGQGLPVSLAGPFHEMVAAGNLSLRCYLSLTEGAVAAIAAHADDSLKQTYLEKMVAGHWSGTMCLTEPHAGTDLGMLRTRAERAGDGSYRITGNKIFITSGEHDLSENIIHLVLAKLPDGPAGARGISLFLVPKFLPDTDGGPGERNGVRCESVEHKMGMRASATAALNFDGATGWIVGPEHQGLACMFTMMNGARYDVGMQSLGLAQQAFQHAVSYANERLQSRSLSGAKVPDQPADPIMVHPDVRRMLLTQKALVEGGRWLAARASLLIDAERLLPDGAERERAARLLALHTPIVKAFLSDMALEVTSLAIQVHGGHGYIRETGVEQFYRDARILAIWEGTNGVQAQDLVRRKLLGDGGEAFDALIGRLRVEADESSGAAELADFRSTTLGLLAEWSALGREVMEAAARDPEEIGATAHDFLHYSALVLLANGWLQMAAAATRRLAEGKDRDFCESKLAAAGFFFDRLLPRAAAHRAALVSGASNLMKPTPEQFLFT